MIIIENNLRLRSAQLPKDIYHAFPWYQDEEILFYSEGEGTTPYDLQTIERMYKRLMEIGELYIIEYFQANRWYAIGDVTLSRNMMPIVIGEKDYRGKGIGKCVITMLIKRAMKLGWSSLKVNKIYTYNTPSRTLFEKSGFVKVATKIDKKGREYNQFELEI
ncbi:GNAT family N-acetyltransferase [Oceanobacillus manasiensis]|uniref:GNAT family N-acetyltransferase n=1 Tax=Oceanobacillus manasiensis TaxID=586413 RepID=UPI0005AA5C06|nr:GNAT family protein [Oceanobacillus manasiensis]